LADDAVVGGRILRRPLPPALKAILPAISADAGRHRARTLLAMLGVGFDYFEVHLTAIDTSLGADSPGLDELRALVRAAREACSTAARKAPHQHVISRALLRSWTSPFQASAEPQLMHHDLASGAAKPRTVGQIGYVKDFVQIGSESVERVWQRVENRLPTAIAAAENGSILANPEFQRVLRDAIALHFARNPHTVEVHAASWRNAYATQVDTIARTPLAMEAFRRKYSGIVPAGEQGLRLGAEAVLSGLTQAEESGALFRLIVEDRFDRAIELLGQTPLELVAPANPDDEFLIGDVPAVTFDAKLNAVGIREGVALTAGDTVMLPLSPRLVVALGPTLQAASVPTGAVDRINQLQVKAAQTYVCYRPGARVGAQVTIWRPPP
jgi:hypothetical protein